MMLNIHCTLEGTADELFQFQAFVAPRVDERVMKGLDQYRVIAVGHLVNIGSPPRPDLYLIVRRTT